MRKSDWAKWLIVIPAMLGIVLVTYVDRITDIWGFGAFICQLIAILELAYGMRIAMLAVYNYLQENNALQNMAFSYTANAKGEVYGIVSETQETKDGNTVNVKYCLYDNGAKTDADGNSCEELVLEKVYPDGNYETELVDFYLVNTDTMQVTDEQKNTW